MSKVLGLLGSPRKGGNSEIILRCFLSELETFGHETELIRLNDLRIKPCQSCDGCAENGNCIIKDEMQDIFMKVKSAAGIIIVTPIYFASMSAQTKVFMDRFQGWWNAKYRLKNPFINKDEQRIGLFISVGAVKNKAFHENAAQIAKMFYSVLNFQLAGQLHYMGYDEAGSIEREEPLSEIKKEAEQFAAIIH